VNLDIDTVVRRLERYMRQPQASPQTPSDAGLTNHLSSPPIQPPTTPSQTDLSSSQRLIDFLETNNLHKKEFADMIGVTLSYVYSLIDQHVAFSTRSTTVERIAVVMGLHPQVFPEYRQPDEPKLLDPGVVFLQQQQSKQGLSNLQFLKAFPRAQRAELVDVWRGALPLPLDWQWLMAIALPLGLAPADIYPYWEQSLQAHLSSGGLNPYSNPALLQAMFDGVRRHLGLTA
jgi:hypothetical protein